MHEDEFLREKQNIRQKMLKYSRAISQGRPLDTFQEESEESDAILKRRFKKRKNASYENFEDHLKEKKSNIYLKEDLINVKLDGQKQSFSFRVLSYIKNKKSKKIIQKKDEKKLSTTAKKIKKNDTSSKIQIPKKEKTIQKLEIPSKNKTAITTQKPKNESKLVKKHKKQPTKTLDDDNAQKAKNTLLQGYTEATKENRNLRLHHLLFAVLLVSFALFLFTPQIYIRNQIYYLSKEIATLKTEENILIEENKELKRSLENMRFQNQILDYLE